MKAQLIGIVISIFLLAGCAADVESLAASEEELVSDIVSMTVRADGRYDVQCRDGHAEVVTADQIQSGQVCNPIPALDGRSIWDELWITAPLATRSELLALFSPGASYANLVPGRFAMRFRTCNVQTGCPVWYNVDGLYFWAEHYPNTVLASPSTQVDLRTDASTGIFLGCAAQSVFDVYWYNGQVNCDDSTVNLVNVQSPYYGYVSPLPMDTAHIRPSLHRTFAHGVSQIYQSAPRSDGSYLQAQYAFFAKYVSSAPTPAFDH